jgi:hypothetical protein
LRKYLSTLLIVILLQAGVYLYLDRVLLVPSVEFTQHSVTEQSSKLPADSQKISSDQKYYVKLESTAVKFYSAANKLEREIPLQAWEIVTYFAWVPNTDVALIGISSDTKKGTSVTLKSVNLEIDSHPYEPKISNLVKGSKITDVAFSGQVNVTYFLIKSPYTTMVYRTDANNHLRKVTIVSTVRRIASLQSQDELLYESKEYSAVYILSGNGKRQQVSPSGGKYALIGTDKDDNIYIGEFSSPGMVSSILKGTMHGDFTEYKALSYPYPATSVTVNFDGKLRLS